MGVELLFMMFVVFGFLAATLVVGWYGRRCVALLLLAIFFVLAVHQFLWEIYSPDYGYRMPWIQTELMPIQSTKLA